MAEVCIGENAACRGLRDTGKDWLSSVVFRQGLRQTGAGSILAKSTTFGRSRETPSAAGRVRPAPAAPPGSIGEVRARDGVKILLEDDARADRGETRFLS